MHDLENNCRVAHQQFFHLCHGRSRVAHDVHDVHDDGRQCRQRIQPIQPVLNALLQGIAVLIEHAFEVDFGQGLTKNSLQRSFAAGESHLPCADMNCIHALDAFVLIVGLVAGKQHKQWTRTTQGQGGNSRSSTDGFILNDEDAADTATIAADGPRRLDEIRCRIDAKTIAIVEQQRQ